MHLSDQFCDLTVRLRRFFEDCLEPAAAPSGRDQFGSLALDLFRLQFRSNPAYRNWCEARGIEAQKVVDWREIPALPSVAFKEMEVSCISPADRKHVFISSGTTGQKGSRHYHNDASIKLYEAAAWPWFARQVLPQPFQREGSTAGTLLCLTPGPLAAPCSSLVHMFEVVRRQLNAPTECFVATVSKDGGWELNLPQVFRSLKAVVNSDRPLWLLGTAFSFVHLLDAMERGNVRLDLPPGSRVMETGGYKGRSRVLTRQELHDTLSARLGIPQSAILSEYGMSELSSQAYSRMNDKTGPTRLFHFPPWARARIISPETGREVAAGETGLIRVLDLANAYSVLCLQTEDLGRKQRDGFEMIGRAETAEPRGCSLMVKGAG